MVGCCFRDKTIICTYYFNVDIMEHTYEQIVRALRVAEVLGT
jgi:hypothetical protein